MVGYSLWGHKELDTTERLHFDFHFPWLLQSLLFNYLPSAKCWQVFLGHLALWELPTICPYISFQPHLPPHPSYTFPFWPGDSSTDPAHSHLWSFAYTAAPPRSAPPHFPPHPVLKHLLILQSSGLKSTSFHQSFANPTPYHDLVNIWTLTPFGETQISLRIW